jgi:hypothetical protein
MALRGWEKHMSFYTKNIKATRTKKITNQMDLVKTKYKQNM